MSVYQRDFATVREEDKKKENLKKEDDRKKGEEMRQAAMQCVSVMSSLMMILVVLSLGRMSSPTLELDEDDVDDSSVDSGPLSKRMKLSSSGDFFTGSLLCALHVSPHAICRSKTSE